MNGCAVSILYFCVILPGALAADAFLGSGGMFSFFGIVFALILFGMRPRVSEDSPASPAAPPDELATLHALVL